MTTIARYRFENNGDDETTNYDLTAVDTVAYSAVVYYEGSYSYAATTAGHQYNATLLDTAPGTQIGIRFYIRFVTEHKSGSAETVIIDKRNTGGNYYYLTFLGSGKFGFYLYSTAGGSQYVQTTQVSWTAGQWYEIVCNCDGTNGIEVVVDGEQDGSNGNARMPSDGTDDHFYVNALMGTEYGHDYFIDDLEIQDTPFGPAPPAGGAWEKWKWWGP